MSSRRQSVAIASHISWTKELHYGVPHSLSVHLFADAIQIETSILPQHVHSAISYVETCISDVKKWMIGKKLKLNDEKTECLLIRPNKYTQNLNCTSLSFGHNVISFTTTAMKLRFQYTDDMRIDAHFQDICAMFTLTYDALAPFVTSLLMQQNHTQCLCASKIRLL